MLRLLGFFALTLVVYMLLTSLPFVGRIAGAVPILGFLLAAAIVSRGISKWGGMALARGKEKALMRELGAVETPHNQGKLGLLLLKQGRYRRAIPLLEAVVRAEPDSAEWNYRLGCAYAGAKQWDSAAEGLMRSTGIDEEHAYGGAMMRLAEALLMLGDGEGSLRALERIDINHGPGPECAYRKGLAYKLLGRKEDAAQAFASVRQLAADAVGYQKKDAALWSLRATAARVF